jgi:hypothetical protein
MADTPTHATQVLISTGAGRTLIFAPIAQGSPGTTQLVAADASGNRIKVVNYVIVMSATGTAKFSDGSGDLTGAMPLSINGGIAAPSQPHSPWFQTAANSALSIVTTGGAATGHIAYFLES